MNVDLTKIDRKHNMVTRLPGKFAETNAKLIEAVSTKYVPPKRQPSRKSVLREIERRQQAEKAKAAKP